MLRILRGPYQVGTTSITAVSGQIGTTLLAGDVLYWTTTAQIYGQIVGNALVVAQN